MMLRRATIATMASTLLACGGAQTAAPTGAVADLLVVGGTVVTMDADRTVIDDGAVAIDDGAIVAVGTAAEVTAAWSGTETIEADPHDLVIPGLINGHGHAAMTLLRGVADDLALMAWLEGYIFPAEAQMVSPEFVTTGTELAALEMIRTGTTTFTDMYYFEQQAAEVVDAVGLRAILGESVLDFPTPDAATPAEALAYTSEFIERWLDHPRVTATVAPHAPFTVAPEVLLQCAELARQHGVPILIHLAETADEVRQVQERYGRSPTAHLDAIGFLGADVVGHHGVWLDDEDIAIVARHGFGLVHNPESNMKLASGTMRVGDLRAAGIPVGLGTDGAASNNDLDMFAAMLFAPLLQKHANVDPTALPAPDVLAMATIEGARAIGLAEAVGSLELGKRGDLVVVDGDAPNLVPRYDVYSHLAYAARGDDVRATVVDGRVLFLDGVFRTLEPARVLETARRIAQRVAEVVGTPG